MRYADTLLTQGEVIVVRARQHWLALFLDARSAVVLWIVGGLLLLAVLVFNLQPGVVKDLMSWIGLGAILIGIVIFILQFWRWWSQDYLVTNRRILKVEGVLNKHSGDSSLEKINDAVLDQNIFGRIFNYGDLDILTAADAAIDQYRMLNKAPAFKREMLQQKYALETEFAYHAPPTPPLRPEAERVAPLPPQIAPAPIAPAPIAPAPIAPAPEPQWQQAPQAQAPLAGDGGAPLTDEGVAASPEAAVAEAAPGAAAEAAPGAAAEAAPSAPHAALNAPAPASNEDDATAVTQTLARLADLRDRGAITPEEYEAKKDELLGRL